MTGFARLDRDDFIRFLRRHREDTFTGGDCQLCPLAVYLTEQDPGVYVEVGSSTFDWYDDSNNLTRQTKLVPWAAAFVNEFDARSETVGRDLSGSECLNIIREIPQ